MNLLGLFGSGSSHLTLVTRNAAGMWLVGLSEVMLANMFFHGDMGGVMIACDV